MRVAIVAEHASSKYGGEAFLPLNYFRLLRARKIEAWLIVHSRTQAELEALFPEERDRIHFISDTWIHKILWRCTLLLPRRVAEMTTGLLSSLYTQSLQRKLVRQIVYQNNIDVVHQPIPVAPKNPSLIFNVGAPVVIGPMNGGMEYPPAFRSRENFLIKPLVSLGRQFADFCNYLLPGKIRAQMLLVSNERTRKALPTGVVGNIIELTENGVDLSVWEPAPLELKTLNPAGINFLFVGRLVDCKAIDLLLLAFQKVVAQINASLEIVGDGNHRQKLEALTHSLGLANQVTFTGWLSQKDCASKLRAGDALVMPSLIECGGAVVLEAMAIGLPVIATKWGGPMDYLDATCGILVEPSSKEEFITGLTNAMLKLARSPELRLQMGRAGQQRVREYFDWERKIDCILDIYHQTCKISKFNQRKLKSLIQVG
ncbi:MULTISPECIES: glycosyltransferase family 4 protein [Nostocales]|uniref:Glycosyltransferase family 4 protein n=3 Tax=Nostocales TaxID=1161 RepID=A0A0C1QXU4_9CYAN|nr:glycosyltransferase family 4 protein [Tolypothrix bouteillei]KAF3886330.1 glycosyltransferase family 4 protein [Tolypothrix bouteillei VB521301]